LIFLHKGYLEEIDILQFRLEVSSRRSYHEHSGPRA